MIFCVGSEGRADMGQDVDVERVTTALNMAGIRYQTFGNKPVRTDWKDKAGTAPEADPILTALAPAASSPPVTSFATVEEACSPEHRTEPFVVAQGAEVQPPLDLSRLATVLSQLRADSLVPLSATSESHEVPHAVPPLPAPAPPAPATGPAGAAYPSLAETGLEPWREVRGQVTPAPIAAAFQPRMAAPAMPPAGAPPAPLGGAASLLATLQTSAVETAGLPASRSTLLAQLGHQPPPVQPAAPSLLAALGVPFAPLAVPSQGTTAAPASLPGMLRGLGAAPSPPSPPPAPPGTTRLAEVLGSLRSSGQA